MTETIIFGGNDNYHLELAQRNPEELTDFTAAMDRYGVILTMSETSESELNDLSSELPTDTHLVRYINPEGDLFGDAVRAYKKSDIFDCYHDEQGGTQGFVSLTSSQDSGPSSRNCSNDSKKAS